MRRPALLLVALIVVVQGCITPSRVMRSWQGHHISELYRSWGPPSSTMSDGMGGTIVSYYYNRYADQIPAGGIRDGGSLATSYTAQRHFFVNSNGVIYSWRWQGL